MVEDIVNGGKHTIRYEQRQVVWDSEFADNWLTSSNGHALAIERMKTKYDKDKPVATANAPIVERVRYGMNWGGKQQFDIGYGLHLGHSFIKTADLEATPYVPWTVEHVESELTEKYNTTLEDVLKLLSESPIEKQFVTHWLDNYYDQNAPALIPEVCGFRAKFYYYKHLGKIYTNFSEIKTTSRDDVSPVNFRFDFLCVNTKKCKTVLVELDGHEFHKTKEQRIIDSIKRNFAAENDLPVVVFTGTKITENIQACFRQLEEILLL